MAAIPNWKRNIAGFMVGQGLSLFGTSLVHYAVMWYITLTTQSGFMMTMIAISGALPIFIISPIAGVWADRYNKKRLINISDAGVAVVTLVMAVIFSFGTDITWLLLICLIARALGQGIQIPAVNALIPELVPEESLTRVNGINGSIQSTMTFASPVLGGVLLAIAPIHVLMYIDVVTATIGISLLLFFVKTPVRVAVPDRKTGVKQYCVDIREGLIYIRKHLFLKKCLVIGALLNIMIAPAALLTPLQVARRWGDDVWRLFGSLSFGAEHRLAAAEVGYAVGMIIGGFLISLWGGFKNKNHTYAICTILVGIASAALGLVESFWIYLAFMGFSGVFLGIRGAPIMAMMQTNIESTYMGRVFSVLMMTATLSMPLGMLVWGPLSDALSIEWLLIGTGGIILLMGAVVLFEKTFLEAGASVCSGEN